MSIGPEDMAGHSTEFAEAAASEEGQQAMIAAAKALATTAVDVLLRPSLFAAIREEFEGASASSTQKAAAGGLTPGPTSSTI